MSLLNLACRGLLYEPARSKTPTGLSPSCWPRAAAPAPTRKLLLTNRHRLRSTKQQLADQYRGHPTTVDLASTGREASIIAALRIQLAAKDNEIKTLKAKVHEQESTIALLYGQLDARNP